MVAMATISWLALISDLFSAITFEPVVRSQNSFFWDHQLKKVGKGTFLHFSIFFYLFWSTAKNGYPKIGAQRTFKTSSDHNFWTVRPIFKIFFWNLYFLWYLIGAMLKVHVFGYISQKMTKTDFRTPSCFLKGNFFLLDLRPKFVSFYVQIQYFLAIKIQKTSTFQISPV